MDKIKNFFVSHFEKFAMVAAILITMMFLIGVFRRGRVDKLQEDIEGLIQTIQINMRGAGVEPEYDPEQIPDYAGKALGPFKNVPEAVRLAGMRWYPVVIIELRPIELELPPGVPFEETFKAYPEREESEPPETTAVRIDNEDFGSVELVDGQHFVLRRRADLPAEDGSTLIHIYYADERHAVRRLEVTIRVVYIPQSPQEIAGYPKPGRNFIIWQTHPDDFEKVVGFNIYRKESKEAGFDIANPLNRKELIQPLDYIPKLGEDEEGKFEEGEGEPTAPDEETAEDEPAEEKEEFKLPGLEEEEVPGERPSIFAQNVGGKFVDGDVTPLQTYWYAVQTVAKKPDEERGRGAPGENEDLYSRSILSEPVMVKGGDVTKIVFVSVMGRLDSPRAKKQARAGIEVRRFVRTDWVVGKFNVKIGDRIGENAWVKDFPKIDSRTGAVTRKGAIVDFTTKYILEDIIAIKKKEPYTVRVFKRDPETGRMISVVETRYREIRTYKIIVRHDDGSTAEHALRIRQIAPKAAVEKKEEEPAPEEEGPGHPPLHGEVDEVE